MKEITRDYLLLFIIIILFGLSWPINKLGVTVISPIWFAAYRLTLATLCMFIVVILLNKFIWPTMRDLPIIAVIGILQRGMFIVFISLGLHYNDAGRSAILVYTTPIWIASIEVLFFKKSFNLTKWIGICISSLGIIIILEPWTIDWKSFNNIVGNIILILAAICWAISIVCTRYMTWTRSTLELAPWQLLIGTIPVIILALIFESYPTTIGWNISITLDLLYTGVFATALAFYLTIIVSRKLPPIFISLNFLFVPISGFIFSMLILHEKMSSSLMYGMILIFSGFIITLFKNQAVKLTFSRDI